MNIALRLVKQHVSFLSSFRPHISTGSNCGCEVQVHASAQSAWGLQVVLRRRRAGFGVCFETMKQGSTSVHFQTVAFLFIRALYVVQAGLPWL